MTKKFKSSLLLLFLVQLFFAQESEWHWQNPYPLPFIDEIHQGIDDWLIVQHASGDMYQINDDGTFTELDMNLPPLDYKNGNGLFKLISKKKWIVFAPYIIYITEDGGVSYEEHTSSVYWQFSKPQFIDDLNGVAKRIKGNSKQLVKTSDGGKTWNKILSGSIPRSFVMFSKDTIYSLNSNGSISKIMRTINGGETWQEMGKCEYCSNIQKVDNSLLIEGGPYVYLSHDGGKTLEEVLFTFDENISFQLELKSTVLGNTIIKSNHKRLFKSSDAGKSWEQFETGYLDLQIRRGFFKNVNDFYCIYRGDHAGIMKLDIQNMTLKPVLGVPISNLQSMHRLDSGILVAPSYDWDNAQIRIFTSEDNGYSWNRYKLKLPNENDYVANAMKFNSDSSLYVLIKNSIYYYNNFTEEYTSIVELDSINYDFNSNYSLNIDEDGQGVLVSHTLDYIYYTEDYFKNFQKISISEYNFHSSWRRSDGKYWLFGQKIDNSNETMVCLLDGNMLDTCYHLESYALFNLLNDDLIVGSEETYPAGMRFSDTEESFFCPALPGYILSIISDDKMIMKNQSLLYLANPQTCEILENINLEYLGNTQDQFKWYDFRFFELENEEILGFSKEGYLMRKTDNFLDTLLYNSSKEVEYETPTQEYQFLVYPNPTSDWLQVKDMPYGVECRIIDMTGREYMYGKQSLIYTGQYPSGTYIIQFIQDGRLIESQKIVIQ